MNPLNYYQDFFTLLEQQGNQDWAQQLQPWLEAYFRDPNHGDYAKWQAAIERLPPVDQRLDSQRNVPRFGADPDDAVPLHQEALNQALLELRPWRKGPLDIGGILIDTEWRCDWKWQRVEPHLSSLEGRHVLDVGCGNGYYSWRMLGAGAASVTGIDPSLLFVMQWLACRHYAGPAPVWVLPLRLEDLPGSVNAYDTVFSMGVLYHRRDPMEHLQRLHELTSEQGELVLETLVNPHGDDIHLEKSDRYARMRNVWQIPQPKTVQGWLAEAGFSDVRMVDMATTTTAEQSSTAWMPFDSLAEALAPGDIAHTVEGHPAPVRAVYVAHK